MEMKTMMKQWKLTEKSLSLDVLESPVTLAMTPGKAMVFAASESNVFCYIEGYQETVFALNAAPKRKPRIAPIAYNTEDFVRLIYSAGSPELAAECGTLSQEAYAARRAQIVRPPEGIQRLIQGLSLKPIENPCQYVQTVQSLLDTRLLVPAPAAAVS